MSIKITDLKDITPTEELVEALSSHNGVIPKALILFRDTDKYEENLKELGIYDEVMGEYYEIRVNRKKSNNKSEFDKKEFEDWLKDNNEFEDILRSSIN